MATTCSACGNEAREGARFCEHCGADLTSMHADAVEAADSEDTMAEEAAAEEELVEAEVDIVADEPLTATHAAPEPPTAEVTLRIIRQPAVVWWAVAALGFAVFFPWLTTPLRINNAMGVPLEFLWSRSAPSDGLALGWVLLGAAGIGAIASIASILAIVRRLAGLVSIAASIAVVVQWIIVLDRADSPDHWLSFIGVGIYTAFFAGVVLLLAPARAKG